MPFGGPHSTVAIEGEAEAETRRIVLHLVSADYLHTLGIPLREGRMLTEREINGSEGVAVVNEAAEFATNDAEPDPAELWTDVYAS